MLSEELKLLLAHLIALAADYLEAGLQVVKLNG